MSYTCVHCDCTCRVIVIRVTVGITQQLRSLTTCRKMPGTFINCKIKWFNLLASWRSASLTPLQHDTITLEEYRNGYLHIHTFPDCGHNHLVEIITGGGKSYLWWTQHSFYCKVCLISNQNGKKTLEVVSDKLRE